MFIILLPYMIGKIEVRGKARRLCIRTDLVQDAEDILTNFAASECCDAADDTFCPVSCTSQDDKYCPVYCSYEMSNTNGRPILYPQVRFLDCMQFVTDNILFKSQDVQNIQIKLAHDTGQTYAPCGSFTHPNTDEIIIVWGDFEEGTLGLELTTLYGKSENHHTCDHPVTLTAPLSVLPMSPPSVPPSSPTSSP